MGKKLKTSQIDQDASASSDQEDYDQGIVASLEAKINEKLLKAQDWLADAAVLPASFQEVQLDSELSTDVRENETVLMKELVSLYRQTKQDDSADDLHHLLLFFAIYMHKYCGESVADHPVLACIAECEELRDAQLARPHVPPVPAAKKQIERVSVNPISREMFRNRGIPKLRSLAKSRQTPRVRQKERFRKAGLKMRSRGHRTRSIAPRVYDGEAAGIRVGLNRAIDI